MLSPFEEIDKKTDRRPYACRADKKIKWGGLYFALPLFLFERSFDLFHAFFMRYIRALRICSQQSSQSVRL